MTQMDLINEYVCENSALEDVLKAIRRGKAPGIQAVEIQEAFGILRNNASSMLNYLFKSGKIVKINSRPVTFLAVDTACCLQKQYGLPRQKSYTLAELQKNILAREIETMDPFAVLFGWDGSLQKQVKLAKAAIIYPPDGLHTLLLGDSGVGKTSFAKAMHEYGRLMQIGANNEYPLVIFNCADYCNNPQLLLSQLFGHVKNAFTGAEKDKIGLVEKADGGILFLDEVHRLPPEGQEMLFYLMDKGEYIRLGDSLKRKSKVLVIAATTESPSSVLLDTFRRRIPITLSLPGYEAKPLDEKLAIIENFFRLEAINIKKTIKVDTAVWQALVACTFTKGNVGRLRSEIKLLCASAFYEYMQGHRDVHVEKAMLSADLLNVQVEKITYIGQLSLAELEIIFPEGIYILPQHLKNSGTCPQNGQLHQMLAAKLNRSDRTSLTKEPLLEFFRVELESHFAAISQYFFEQGMSLAALQKDFSEQELVAAVTLLKAVRPAMGTALSNTTFFAVLAWLQQWRLDRLLLPWPDDTVIGQLFQQKAAKELAGAYQAIEQWWHRQEDNRAVEQCSAILALLVSFEKIAKKGRCPL